ncbi:MAG TPA: invasion associated locus B family protein [Xanthobacteraceae bacterium]|nr:invasion associated locus B family protein [Xanthobacteraceae bacterium]
MHLIKSVSLAATFTLMLLCPVAAQSAGGPVAWRVECGGDGKSLECRAIQQLARPDTKQVFAAVAVRFAPELKAASMTILLPLGLNLTEPVTIRVDNGMPERQPIQTCDNGGCLVSLTVPDKLLAAMRTGTDLKLTVQDASKKPIELAFPLLGFGLAYDKAK